MTPIRAIHRNRRIVILSALALAVFCADFFFQETWWIGYIPLTLLGARMKRPFYIPAFASVSTLLILAGFFLSPSAEPTFQTDLLNRSLGILVIWILSAACMGIRPHLLKKEPAPEAPPETIPEKKVRAKPRIPVFQGDGMFRVSETLDQDTFISLLCHDLRSPLISAAGLLRLLEKKTGDLYGVEQRDILKSAIQCCEKMEKLVDRLLNINRFQMGKVPLNPDLLNAREVADGVIEGLKDPIREKRVSVENMVDETTTLYADTELFTEVIHNLVGNAIKFTHAGGQIRIHTPEGKYNSIAVTDTGTGIRRDVLPRLFRMEEKISLRGTGGEQGTGLGLLLCKEIVALHGGTLSVKSEEGIGSTFTVSLPDFRPTVLVVEDNADDLYLCRKILHPLDLEIHEAETGWDALNFLEKRTPNLVILDIFLPRMNGFDLVTEIRNTSKTRDLPIIIWTVDDRIRTQRKALELGANEFAPKSLDPEVFVSLVQKYIRDLRPVGGPRQLLLL